MTVVKRQMKNNFSTKVILSAILIFSLFTTFVSAAEQTNVHKLYAQGKQALEQDDYYQAQQYYLEVVAANPAFTDAWFELAECSYKLGEFDLALNYLTNAEKNEKNNIKIQNLKGMILLSLGRINEGRAIFNDILKKYPNDVDAHFGLAEIELYEGRYTGAENQYNEALKRQSNNRNALLSLSLIYAERGKYSEADRYIKMALLNYSGDAGVHYIAAVIYSLKGDYILSENHSRIAVEINGNYERAYELLASVLYKQKRFQEVLDIADFLISRNRKNSTAWYLKGVVLQKQKKKLNAIETWSAGLSVSPQDEIMRMAMELEIRDSLTVEDGRRSSWAKYHIDNAKQYKSRYDSTGSSYEYQRALFLDPLNYEARMAYADILDLNGMHELYLEQLNFIKQHNFNKLSVQRQRTIDDKIEAYDSLLEDTIAKNWKVEPFYLDKTRWNIAIFYENDNSSFEHVDINQLAARAAADIFSGVAVTSVKTQVTPVSDFGEAFKNARTHNFDYFIILSLNEGQGDMTLKTKMYSARTGLEITNKTFYCTGNNRFSTILRRFRKSVLDTLPVRGKILGRNGKNLLIDLGKSENISKDAQFKIIRKGAVKTADNKPGIFYNESDVLGTIQISKLGEEVSEAIIVNNGFYDKINIDDEVVLITLTDDKKNTPIDNVPAANENGQTVVKSEIKNSDLLKEIKENVSQPSILQLLRSIY